MDKRQMSDSFILNLLLAFSGGLQDAYTYVNRGGVFANAQTGNLVKGSMFFLEGDWLEGLNSLLPVLAFAAGVIIADAIHEKYRNHGFIHWRQAVLGYEVAVLAVTAFLPQSANMTANLMVSFVCAMQVEAFRKIHGYGYASTMCIGNLRSGTSALSDWMRTKNLKALDSAKYYFSVIFVFSLGAGVGAVCSKQMGEPTILISVVVLSLCLVMMQNWPGHQTASISAELRELLEEMEI